MESQTSYVSHVRVCTERCLRPPTRVTSDDSIASLLGFEPMTNSSPRISSCPSRMASTALWIDGLATSIQCTQLSGFEEQHDVFLLASFVEAQESEVRGPHQWNTLVAFASSAQFDRARW